MAESDETRVVGVLYAKDLVGIGFERQLSLKRVLGAFDAQKRVHEISTDTKLGAAFDICKQCRIHLLIVVDKNKRNWPMVRPYLRVDRPPSTRRFSTNAP